MRRHQTLALAALTSLAVVAAACGDSEDSTDAPTQPPPSVEPAATIAPVTPVPAPEAVEPSPAEEAAAGIGEPVAAPVLADLVLPDGSGFDLAELQGENTLVFFGYTHCPDVCPQTIGELYGVFEALPQTQAVFVSVDPERDTPEFLQEWIAYKPENFYAVTGTPGAIRRAADNYGVKYARVETTSTSGYTMSHTADIYLIDADGRYLSAYPFGTPAAEIVEDLELLNAS